MAIDYDAMNARIKALALANTKVITPTDTAATTARSASVTTPTNYTTGQKGTTITGTPYEINKIKTALGSGGTYDPKTGTLWSGSKSGTSRQYSVMGSGEKASQALSSGVGTKINPNSANAQTADQIAQMMEEAGVIGGSALASQLGSKNSAKSLAALSLMGAGLQDYNTQKKSFEQQGKNYQEGTNLLTDAVTEGNKALDALSGKITSQMESGVSPLWERAMAKADEFVANANTRTKEVLAGVDKSISEMKLAGSFEKAHAMQVSVQSALGSMADEQQTIARRFGADSPEMMQFNQQKQTTLASVQSSIHTEYAKLNSEMTQNMASVRASTSQNMAMYENYNEQAALGVYQAAATADQQLKLQYTEQLIGLEQLKMSNQTELATWISKTPVFSTSLTSFLASAYEMVGNS